MPHDEGPAPSTPAPVPQPIPPLVSSFPIEDGHAAARPLSPALRAMALLEVLLCSGVPTQLVVMQALWGVGIQPLTPEGRLSITYVASLSLADGALLVGLALIFLRAHGESAREALLGWRPIRREIWIGLLLTPVAFFIAVLILGLVLRYAPWLHNVPDNPLADLITSPRDALIFVVVAVFAGGVREEVQRAFILRRFERYLGGAIVGLAVFSVAFGAGHVIQGRDVAIITGVLGAFWGLVYLRRRSVVAPVVSHALFNVGQIAQHSFFP